MTRKEAEAYRSALDTVTGTVDDAAADDVAVLFRPWCAGAEVYAGDRRHYEGKVYRCIQPHTTQPDWTPDVTPALWTPCAAPGEEWPEWRQPLGAEDAYHKGDKVSCDGLHWISDIDNNVWRPGAYGWTQAE